MVEIEFLDPEDPSVPVGEDAEEIGTDPARRTPFDSRNLVGVLFLLAAAVLAVVAGFQQVVVIRQTGGGAQFVLSADGWGRVSVGNGAAVAAGFHEPRYGVALCAAAGLVLLAAGALAADALNRSPEPGRLRRLRAPALIAAVGATGLLVGLAAAVWLVTDARFSGYRSNIQGDAAGPPPLDLGQGACVWLTAAAAVAAGLGTGAVVRRQRDEYHPPIA